MEPHKPELIYNLPDSVILPKWIKAKLEEAIDGDPEINRKSRGDYKFAHSLAVETKVAFEVAYDLIQRMCTESNLDSQPESVIFNDQLELANVALFDFFPKANRLIGQVAMELDRKTGAASLDT